MYPTTWFGRNERTFYRYDGSPTNHGDIGKSKLLGNNGAYEWIKSEATRAGVSF